MDDDIPAAPDDFSLLELPDHERLALVEIVNRVLDRGVIVTGEVTISLGGVDLLFLGLQIILSSVQTLEDSGDVRMRGLVPAREPEPRTPRDED